MDKKFLKSRTLSLVIVFISMAMIYYGHTNGETKVVLDKAIRICMECIGIG
ncbi:CD1871A family CXXC motif-containing protein [Peptostreptococcus anaerobius]|uniref:CD1871A family CXXC motif-containing protein n=1 Tax=Peptostreptococcus anaerobius TaxID=1261 RepID=UPI00232DB74C|nr:CD1871A family CXXC motif-containing protein [Peptostreptococcus anaerobius]MDB8822302.1 CD1871A family CXXC motif-containing protein [Peptostreptococcus anaerobius]MDB8826924.1 CD1871A family CXXC motif-containing protein [Peptostreptococcus anaerobius]MDB8828796.1 CD1871A family CXXC motif-containing protein [Peptostreptococcus anaerobius]MDB8830615.1 CD1871A family CXXC motif-containing protein [Peptostreptococcus anaerobius]MDB8832459.1 CD1871A family CXXC motif-containing protein [Pept